MKNPWMSLWLSAANKAAGAARGHWMAEARRQQKALAARTARELDGRPEEAGGAEAAGEVIRVLLALALLGSRPAAASPRRRRRAPGSTRTRRRSSAR